MTMISQDEIVSNAKTVTKGLEALRQEHESILCGIKSSLEQTGDLGAENSLIQARVTDPDPGLFCRFRDFFRFRDFCKIRDFLTDPALFVGSGTSCRIRDFLPDPSLLGGSATSCQIRDFSPDNRFLAVSGTSCRIQDCLLDPGLLAGSGTVC
jgi:hypothetical protein